MFSNGSERDAIMGLNRRYLISISNLRSSLTIPLRYSVCLQILRYDEDKSAGTPNESRTLLSRAIETHLPGSPSINKNDKKPTENDDEIGTVSTVMTRAEQVSTFRRPRNAPALS